MRAKIKAAILNGSTVEDEWVFRPVRADLQATADHLAQDLPDGYRVFLWADPAAATTSPPDARAEA